MMKGFEQQNNATENPVEDWTLLQCKEYLDKYPNGLKALQVKKQLSKLQSIINQKVITPVSINKSKKTARSQSNSNTATSLCSNTDSNVNKSNSTFMNMRSLIVFVLFLVALLVSAILCNI